MVAIDPRNGAILAFADFPSYDPNVLASHNQDEVRKAWADLNADEERPLLPRTYRERYFPGSSFKVVTAAAALADGVVTLSQPAYPTLTELPLPQSSEPLRNFGGSACGGPLPEILRISCNTAFAQMGLDMGAESLSSGAGDFGFNKAPPIDMPFAAESVFPDPSAFARDKPALAKSAIGQQDVQATPLQMALVAAGIANNGIIMTPHVMAEVRDSKAEVLDSYEPEAVADGGAARGRPRRAGHDGRGGGLGVGRQRPDPGRGRRRQDRYRPDRPGHVAHLVHRLRPGRGPPGGGGGHAREPAQRQRVHGWRAGRPHRPGRDGRRPGGRLRARAGDRPGFGPLA